jgi:hypothetical protein
MVRVPVFVDYALVQVESGLSPLPPLIGLQEPVLSICFGAKVLVPCLSSGIRSLLFQFPL